MIDLRARGIAAFLLAVFVVAQAAGEEKSKAISPPVIKLLEQGEEPRAPLRTVVKKGAKQTLVLTTGMEMAMKVGDRSAPKTKLPAQKMTMDITVTDVSSTGDITYEFKLSKAEVSEEEGVNPVVVQSIKGMVEQLKGLNGRVVTTDRGLTKEAELKASETLNPALQQLASGLKQSISQLSNPYPEEGVGIGAKWEVHQDIELNGVRAKQVSTYELVERKGSTGKLKVTLKQSANPQAVKPPGLPQGAQVQLHSMTGKGSGEIVFDTSRIGPRTANVNANSEMEMETSFAGQKQKSAMSMKIVMQMEGK